MSSKKSKSAPPTPPHLLRLLLPLLLLSGIVSFAIYQFFYTSKQTPNPVPPSSGKKVIQPNAVFYTKTFLSRHQTYLNFSYRFEAEPQMMVLSLSPQVGYPTPSRLIMHPLLYSLSWPSFHSDSLTLFQRQKNFSSLEAFLSKPPSIDQIMIDDAVITLTDGQFSKCSKLDEYTPEIPASINYLLTSFLPTVESKGWFYYQTTFDATTAQVNQDGELIWIIIVPTASETNPFYLGDIHVDYRQ